MEPFFYAKMGCFYYILYTLDWRNGVDGYSGNISGDEEHYSKLSRDMCFTKTSKKVINGYKHNCNV